MKLLEERILKDGKLLPGSVLKVDNFLNQQIDINLITELGAEWKKLYKNDGVTKILTIEASGIAIACITAMQFGVPVVFAKKTKTANLADELYNSKVVSYTHGQAYDVIVSKSHILPGERVLIIDDFLANGSALKALISIVEQAGATVVGAGIAIEKVYQNGGNEIRERGYRVESLAKISSITEKYGITFC